MYGESMAGRFRRSMIENHLPLLPPSLVHRIRKMIVLEIKREEDFHYSLSRVLCIEGNVGARENKEVECEISPVAENAITGAIRDVTRLKFCIAPFSKFSKEGAAARKFG